MELESIKSDVEINKNGREREEKENAKLWSQLYDHQELISQARETLEDLLEKPEVKGNADVKKDTEEPSLSQLIADALEGKKNFSPDEKVELAERVSNIDSAFTQLKDGLLKLSKELEKDLKPKLETPSVE